MDAMKVLLDIPDQKAAALLDVLQHISYVKAQPLSEEVVFEAKEQSEPLRKTPKLDGGEGRIWMADDFDEPMEEFEEQTETVPIELMFGCMKGKIWMSDDFDAPMEEFEEYM